MWENNAQTSSIISKESSSQATTSQGSMSGKAANSSSQTEKQSRLVYLNEKKSTRPELPRVSKQPKGKLAHFQYYLMLRTMYTYLLLVHFDLNLFSLILSFYNLHFIII